MMNFTLRDLEKNNGLNLLEYELHSKYWSKADFGPKIIGILYYILLVGNSLSTNNYLIKKRKCTMLH